MSEIGHYMEVASRLKGERDEAIERLRKTVDNDHVIVERDLITDLIANLDSGYSDTQGLARRAREALS